LETVANPYTTVLGPPETAASRINFAQTFNAVGWILGPLVGSILIFHNKTEKSISELFFDAINKVFTGAQSVVHSAAETAHELAGTVADNSSLILPYVGLGIVVLLVLAMFFFTKLPEVKADDGHGASPNGAAFNNKPLIAQRHFVLAVIAQFLYVAAQTGINSFFINYAIEVKDVVLTEVQAGLLLGMGGMGLFAVGRFTGSMVMRAMKPGLLLGTFALLNTLLMLFTSMNHNRFGVMALMLCYLFMSVMFPSIFALGLRGLGEKTKTASSILVMTIVGGAIAPWLMGVIGAVHMNIGFLIPMVCFAFISFYGYFGSKVKE
jgi:FHS family L-fucose permease-like MFS transporter